MARIGQQANLSDRFTEQAQAYYQRRRVPAAFAHMPPQALNILWRECGGDWRRCVADDDGSVTVLNRPAWEPEA